MESSSWFAGRTTLSANTDDEPMDPELISTTFTQLHKRLLQVSIPNQRAGLEEENRESVDWLSNFAIEMWNNDDEASTTTTATESDPTRYEYMRASQIVLRWYLQVYSSQRNQFHTQQQQQQTDLMIACFQTRTMLELYMRWIEKLVHLDEKRFASQLLFYSTFPGMESCSLYDELQKDYQYLVEQCHMPQIILNLLWTLDPPVPSFMRLILSLVRNIHNALTTFPQQALKVIKETSIDVSIWNHYKNDWFPERRTKRISFEIIFRELAIYLLLHQQKQDTDFLDNNKDRHDELIVEILRCCYAMRVNFLENHDRWRMLVNRALQFPTFCYDCHLAVLPLLMDAPTEEWSLQEHVEVLLTILEKQIDTTMENRWVDDRAASALTPVLAVLYRFCVMDATFCRSIQVGIFPYNEDIDFSEEEKEGIAKNVAPLDAPKGTLRWKVIQLLTWPQSFVKRLAGELLWTLSGNQQQVFVRRVGMGNALPTLGLKGLVQMPPGLNS